jgi:hypothetical protein
MHVRRFANRPYDSLALQQVMSMVKPRLSFWQIWNMSFGFLGIR